LKPILVVALATMLAGCGGGETKLDRQAYAAKLSAMCEDFAAREKKIGEPHTLDDVAERGPQIVQAFDEAIRDQVRGLKASEEIAAQARRFREIADEQHDVLTALAVAAKQNDPEKVLELNARNQALNREAGSIARALGAAECAPPG
jgi:hypothetical protein